MFSSSKFRQSQAEGESKNWEERNKKSGLADSVLNFETKLVMFEHSFI